MKKFLLTFAFAFSILFFNKLDSEAAPSEQIISFSTSTYDYVYTVYSPTGHNILFVVTNNRLYFTSLMPFSLTVIRDGLPYTDFVSQPTFSSSARLYVYNASYLYSATSSFNPEPIFVSDFGYSYLQDNPYYVPPSQYVPEIGFGYTLTHFSLFGLNDTTECIRALSLLVVPGTRPDNYKYSIYVNNVEKDKGEFNGLFNFSKNFKHSTYDIVNGDNIRFVVVPYKDGNYGNAHEVSWVARNRIIKDNQKPILDSPFVDVNINIPIDNSTNISVPVDISQNHNIVYQGTTDITISSSDSYSQNIDISNYENNESSIIQYIDNSINYFYGDSITEIVNNNTINNNYDFDFNFNFGPGDDDELSSFWDELKLLFDAVITFILGISFLPKIFFTCLTIGFGFLFGIIALVFLKR